MRYSLAMLAALRRLSLLLAPTLCLAAALSAAASCGPQPMPQTVVIAACPSSDAAGIEPEEPFESDQSSEALGLATPCARACKQYSVLGCPEAKKPMGGRTCVETCKAIGPISSFDAMCVVAAKDATAARKCPQVRCLKP